MNLTSKILKLFSAKWKFKIQKKPILIYDGEGNSKKKLSQIISEKKINVFYNRGEEINILILLKVLFLKGFFNIKNNYRYEFIKTCNPKVIVTFIDTNLVFFKLKKLFPSIMFIAIQSGIKSKEILNQLNLNYSNNQIDYYFVFSKYYATELKKKIKANFIVSGSFKSNMIDLKNTNSKDIIFISKQIPNYLGLPVPFHEFQILKLLNDYSLKNKLKLDVVLKHDMCEEYQNFLIKNNLKNITIKFSSSNYGSYKICKDYKIIVNSDSTLGYEMLALKKKVIFICYGSMESKKWNKKYNYPNSITRFGYPGFKKKKMGKFWINYLDKKNIFKLLNEYIYMNENKWYKKFKKIIFDVMSYNKDNSLLISILRKKINH